MSESNVAKMPPIDPLAGVKWRALSDAVFAGGGPVFNTETLALIRAMPMVTRDALLAPWPTYEESTVESSDSTWRLSVFRPGTPQPDPAPGVVWIHGGGMVTGDRYAATEAFEMFAPLGATIVSVEYRLAPEYPGLIPSRDCRAALEWTAEHAMELNISHDALFLAGNSAGGGLAASVALQVRDQGGPAIAGVLLASPMLDDRLHTEPSELDHLLLWGPSSNRFGWSSLLGDRFGTEDVHPYEAPARSTDLTGLPPLLIDVGSVDLFREESTAFASRLWQHGANAELVVWAGGYHGIELLAPETRLGSAVLGHRRDWVHRVLDAAAYSEDS